MQIWGDGCYTKISQNKGPECLKCLRGSKKVSETGAEWARKRNRGDYRGIRGLGWCLDHVGFHKPLNFLWLLSQITREVLFNICDDPVYVSTLWYPAPRYNVNSIRPRTLLVLCIYGILKHKRYPVNLWMNKLLNWTAAILLKDIRIKHDHCNEVGRKKHFEMGSRLGSVSYSV